MTVAASFYLLFGLTALFLLAAVVTGKQGRRGAHLRCVVAMTLCLFATIGQAMVMGKSLEFPPDRYAVHMPLARLALLALLGPWITGPLYWKGKVGRKAHLAGAGLFLILATGAIVTGFWMLAGAIPKNP